MKTLNFLIITSILLLISKINIFAQDTSVSYYRNEITFGMGYAYGFEKSVFNLTEDNAVESAVGININYCYYLNKEIGLGARFFGYTKELNEYYLYYPDGSTKKTTYTLSAGNLDAEFRYVFNRGVVEPYGFLLFGLTSGSASDDISDLSFSGFNIGAGAGAKLKIG
ncbi:MAG: hypothetical protein L0Y76_12870, partial [Ignavibacteria bacterium]|nr:hypothetical protein [Ignavibacteria bacterium]